MHGVIIVTIVCYVLLAFMVWIVVLERDRLMAFMDLFGSKHDRLITESPVLWFPSISLVTVSGRSGTLVGKGSAIIMTTDANPLSWMPDDLWVVCESRMWLIHARSAISGLSYCVAIIPEIFFYYVAEMDLFVFICHSDPTKVRIGEREPAKREVKLLTLTEGHTISLNPPSSDASGGSSDIAVEKTKKKQKRKAGGDASGFTFTHKKLREDYHAAASNIGGKSLATIRGLIPDGSCVSSGVTKPQAVVSVTPTPEDGPMNSVSGLDFRICPPSLRYVVSSDDSHHSTSCSEVNSFARSPVADIPVTTVVVTTIITVDTSAVNANAAGTSKLNEHAVSSDSFYASLDLDSETLRRIYVPKWNVTNDSVLDDPYLYTEFNVGAARQVCLGAEVRMRAEHTLEQKDRLEDKCSEQTALLSERDAEIAHLKSLLSLKEVEAVEAIRLCGQLSVVEAADAAKGNELRDLKERNFVLEGEKKTLSEKVTTLKSVATLKETELASLTAKVTQLTFELSGFQLSRDELSSKVVSLESERDRLVDQSSSLESAFELFKGRMEAMQDEQATVLGNRVAELDAQLLEIAAHLNEEFYPRFLTAISGRWWILTHGLKLVLLKCLQSLEYCHALGQAIGCAINKGIQDGLKAGVDHGKTRRDLSVIEAYDPSVEAKYIDAVNALGTVDFSLISKLKSKKDASMVDLMDSLHLEGPLAEIPRAKDLQPSPEQLMLPIHRPEDNVVLGETSLSFSLQVVYSRVQKVRGEIKEKRLSLTDVMVPLAKPLSSKSLIGEASTSAALATAEPITTLSTTSASSGVVPPLSVSDYQVLDAEPHDEDPPATT
ncbi:hypothetical protein Tco_0590497 [Tanacetum coccineum]